VEIAAVNDDDRDESSLLNESTEVQEHGRRPRA
jgi:hypothetical protein